jgi:hypothetical protein
MTPVLKVPAGESMTISNDRLRLEVEIQISPLTGKHEAPLIPFGHVVVMFEFA